MQPLAPAGADQRDDVLARASTQAIASCATVAPRASATARSASTSARLRSRFSPWKRGLRARKSRSASSRSRRPVAGQQAAREHAVGGDRRCRARGRRAGSPSSIPREMQRVLDLEVGDRVHGGGAADRLGADLGEPDVADVAGLRRARRWRRSSPRSARPGRAARAGRRRRGRCRAGAACRRGSSSRPRGARRSRASAPSGSRRAPNFTLIVTASRSRPAQRPRDEQLVVAHAVEVAGVDAA